MAGTSAVAVTVGKPSDAREPIPLGLKVLLAVVATALALAIALMLIFGPPEVVYSGPGLLRPGS